jgi:hypothetical protein
LATSQSTFVTSIYNTCNTLLKYLKHLKHTLATCGSHPVFFCTTQHRAGEQPISASQRPRMVTRPPLLAAWPRHGGGWSTTWRGRGRRRGWGAPWGWWRRHAGVGRGATKVGRVASPCGAEWGEERGAARDGSECGVSALEKATARSLVLKKGAALSLFFRSGPTSGPR